MNKVTVNKPQNAESPDKAPEERSPLANGEPRQHATAPQKSLPDLPPPKTIPERKQLSIPKIESPEGYYEEAEPYDMSLNGHSGRAPSTGVPRWVQVPEGVIYATITLGTACPQSGDASDPVPAAWLPEAGCMPLAWPLPSPCPPAWVPHAGCHSSIDPCLWPEDSALLGCSALSPRTGGYRHRQGQAGASPLPPAEAREEEAEAGRQPAGSDAQTELPLFEVTCYKSSKDHSPQLDVNLLGSSVVHKEKQVRKKEHKLKITPMNADVIVLGLQSKDQAEQWLRVIQEVSGLPSDGAAEGNQYSPEAQRLSCQKADISEKYLSASEYGSSVDGHPEVPETKDVKKKCSAGLKLSNLMNLGRKKSTSLESADRSLETACYLNVLVNSQWKSRWCSVRDSHLHFYQDRNRSKVAQQPLSLVGCEVVPDPSPDHLYSFRILHNGEELAKLEAKSSEEMGHWLGLLLSESGSKTDPEEFTYDYVDADRVSCIVSAAKNSLLLMQRKFSEPNTYIDGLPSQDRPELLYDDVEMSELTAAVDPEEAAPATDAPSELDPDRMYLDLTPVKSFLHSQGGTQARGCSPTPPCLDPPAEALPADPGPAPAEPPVVTSAETPELQQVQQESLEPEELSPRISMVKIQTEQQKLSFSSSCPDAVAVTAAGASTPAKDRLRVTSAEIKLGKNRTEAEVKRYTEEKERLEKKKEEIRGHLAQLRKEKRELRETLSRCTDKGALASLEQKLKEIDEECRVEERRRVDLELSIVEVKDNLKKAEAGPVTLGTTVDTSHLETVSPRASLFCHHSPKPPPPPLPQTVPPSTLPRRSRTDLFPSWSQAKAPSSRKPRNGRRKGPVRTQASLQASPVHGDLGDNPASARPSFKQRLCERVSLFKRKSKDGGPRTESSG
ncbi:actin filament-associated protein 1-like 2 [Myotis lucifugus]|uniref:actin filament-associated protein 1-like 2 n=1 Tax=Myotis lucifugus TaxID=59463 RepID=UPI000CCC1A8D|nr:actin filament-associated protein 1-like 2 [Myotis lucifugus]